MSQQELFDYVVNTPHNTNPVILKQLIKGVSGASSWNDLTDKPFWVEEKKIIVYETEPMESGWISIPQQELVDGKKYTYCVDGVMYTDNARYEDTDAMYCVNLYDSDGKHIGSIYETALFLYPDYFDSAVSHKIERVETIVHKLDSKYLPDPFWVEEKRTLVVEGVPNEYSQYDVQSRLVAGKEYTYCIDGVEYTGKAVREAPDYYVHLVDDMDKFVCYVYDYCIDLKDSDILDPNEYHKFELIERVYHTYHDFMVIINRQEGENQPSNYKLVAGNFAEARTRILKGLPVTAYVCQTTTGEKHTEYLNCEVLITYYKERGEEKMICSVNGNTFGITSNNKITIL